MTSWLNIPDLYRVSGDQPLFYFDAELRWTLEFRPLLDRLFRKRKLAGIATHSRYIQSWYMAEYGLRPALIQEWSDPDLFRPDASRRVQGRIGCFVDDAEQEGWLHQISQALSQDPGVESLIRIQGEEAQVIEQLQTVDIFLGLNPGKHPFWGEGCPRTQQEAMHCGCVVIAFDVLGNREYLHHDWTGYLIPTRQVDRLILAIKSLLRNPQEKERLRSNSLAYIQATFSPRGKLPLIQEFLRLSHNT